MCESVWCVCVSVWCVYVCGVCVVRVCVGCGAWRPGCQALAWHGIVVVAELDASVSMGHTQLEGATQHSELLM